MYNFSLMYTSHKKGAEIEVENAKQFTWIYRDKVEQIKDWVEKVSSRAILLTNAFLFAL